SSCSSSTYSAPMPFFFQAEDGIRDRNVTGVQTCALPILSSGPPSVLMPNSAPSWSSKSPMPSMSSRIDLPGLALPRCARGGATRSEERRVGKECRSRRTRDDQKTKEHNMEGDNHGSAYSL